MKKLIESLSEELSKAENRVAALQRAIRALQSDEMVGEPYTGKPTLADKRLQALEKARAARWGDNKFSGRKAKLDKALRKIFVDSSRFTVNQTLQVLRHNGITQAAYRDRRSFGNCVYHSLREMAKEGLVRAVRPEGVKEIIWETVQPQLPMVTPPNETHEVSEL